MRIIALPRKLLIRNHRLAGAGDGSHGVRGTPELRRPERSGDRMASGGRQNCDDRSEAETEAEYEKGPVELFPAEPTDEGAGDGNRKIFRCPET